MLPWLEDDRPRDACGEQSLDGVVQSSRQATVAQIAEKVNDGSARKVSEQMYYSWLAADRSGCPWWPLSTAESTNSRLVSYWTTEQWKKEPWSDDSDQATAHQGNLWHQDALWEEGKAVWCFGPCPAG